MRKITWMVVIGLTGVLLLAGTGCQPWEKKYKACNAELENLQALFDSANESSQQCSAELARLNQQLQAEHGKAEPRQGESDLEKEGGKYDPSRGTITVTLENNVLFASGKVSLKNESEARLQKIASIIKRDYPGREVWVMGHTDTDPIKKSGWKDNWELSTERALAVLRYLTSQGIEPKSMVAAGRGQYHPVGSSKEQNRRVEIIVYTR